MLLLTLLLMALMPSLSAAPSYYGGVDFVWSDDTPPPAAEPEDTGQTVTFHLHHRSTERCARFADHGPSRSSAPDFWRPPMNA